MKSMKRILEFEENEKNQECDICLEVIEKTWFSDCCQRLLCLNCSIENAEANMESSKCISCVKKLGQKQLLKLFEFTKSTKLKILEEKKSKNETRYCKKCDLYYILPKLKTIDGIITSKCTNCDSCEHCLICEEEVIGIEVERKAHKCEIFKIKLDNSKKCIGCKIPILKEIGCDHMKCKNCGFEFCWICEENWTPSHLFSDCKTIFFPNEFKDMQQFGEHVVTRCKRYVLQSGEWKMFVNGLIALANNWKLSKIFGKYENLILKTNTTIEDLTKIFGLKYREIPLQKPSKVELNEIREALISWMNQYVKTGCLFYIIYKIMKPGEPEITLEYKNHLKLLINDLIVRDEFRHILKEKESIVYEFIDFIQESNVKIFTYEIIEKWLLENFLESLSKMEKAKEYVKYFKLYVTDFSFENNFIKITHPTNLVITAKSPFEGKIIL